MILSVLTFIAGAALLYAGAEGLVRGAITTAKIFEIRPVIIGLTVIAFGTSAPEFIVSLISTFAGSSDIALGNVVGSNIANIGLILGIAALLRPVEIDKRSLTFYFPVLLISSVILYLFAFADSIGFFHGSLLLTGITVFTWHLIKRSEKTQDQKASEVNHTNNRRRMQWKEFVLIIGGAVLLLFGSRLMVVSGVSIARTLGVSEFVIGITLVAIGTSLPEFAAIIVSILKKNTEIILGNIIGSNIFNILFVIGGVSVIHPILVNVSARFFEFPVMIAFSILLYIFMRTGFVVNRIEGAILLAGYVIFLMLLF